MTGIEGGEMEPWQFFSYPHSTLAGFWRQRQSSLLLGNVSLLLCHEPLLCFSNASFHCKVLFSCYSSVVHVLWYLGCCRDLKACILQYLFPFCKYSKAHCNTSGILQLAYEWIVVPTGEWLKCRHWEQLFTVKSHFPVGLFWAQRISLGK